MTQTTTPSGRPPYERYAAALERLPAADRSAPLGLLDLDAFRANATALRKRSGGLPVRVASKSLRIRRAVLEALSLDGYAGILAYALPEAVWWARSGQPDVLVAYPSVDRAALAEWVADPVLRAAVTVAVDSPDHLALIARVAEEAGVRLDDDALPPLRLCLDVDAAWQPAAALRFGALRSPVRTPEQAAAMARRIVRTPGTALVGVLAYEGQVAGLPEGTGPRSALVAVIKRGSLHDLRHRRPALVAAVREVLREAGQDLEFVNGGGTGSADLTSRDPSVTEIGAGSGLMGPASFDGFRHLSLRPASFFTRPVVRRPGTGVVTVAGGGWAASGVPGPDRSPVVAWPEGLHYSPQEGAGEVQTPLRGAAADALSLGDPVFFRHAKAGEPAEHLAAVAVYSAEEDAIVDLWPTYRGEGKAFG